MASRITFYAVYLREADQHAPVGLARRHTFDDGAIDDEMLRHNLSWTSDTIVTEWKRGDSAEELVEISAEEAEALVERFRERWGGRGDGA